MEIHTEKTLWYHKGDRFTVEVAVWSNPKDREILPLNILSLIPKYHWNIYAHIFPKHPLFNAIIQKHLFDYGIDIPLHCGASYHKWDYNENGKVVAKHIGSDYHHCDDDRFGGYATKQEAWEVFRDADELINFLQREDARARQGEGPGHNTQQGQTAIAEVNMQSGATAV